MWPPFFFRQARHYICCITHYAFSVAHLTFTRTLKIEHCGFMIHKFTLRVPNRTLWIASCAATTCTLALITDHSHTIQAFCATTTCSNRYPHSHYTHSTGLACYNWQQLCDHATHEQHRILTAQQPVQLVCARSETFTRDFTRYHIS